MPFLSFPDTGSALARMTFDGSTLKAYAQTLSVIAIGVAIFAVVGIGVGLWIGLSAKFGWLFAPIFVVIQAAPLAALIPLLMRIYGIGLTSTVVALYIIALPVIVLNTAAAIHNVSRICVDVRALKDLSLEFPQGWLTSLLGPSGCGKTALMQIIASLLPATSREVLVNSAKATQPGPHKSFVFQDFALLLRATEIRGVAFGLELPRPVGGCASFAVR